MARTPRLPAGTVTLLFSDIEGSTMLARRLREHWPAVLHAYYTQLRRALAARGGVEVDTAGDGMLAAFVRAREAVAAAADVQRAMASYAWPDGTTIRVRMGLHTGEPMPTHDGYAGLDTHRGARVMASGHGGQVLLTPAVVEVVGDDLPGGLAVRDLGKYVLKDFPRPERVFQLVIEGLPATFPPLHAVGGWPGQLPRRGAALVGRQREVAQLAQLLAGGTPRLVTLTGPGGVGKTCLALHVARELLPHFEGVFFVELAAVRDPALVVPAIAAALGIGAGGGSTVAEAVAGELGDREVLLVLDNIEQVVAAAAALGDLLARTGGLRLLVTSRTPLRLSAEQVIPVAPLAAGDAAELFVARVRAAGHDVVADEDEEAVAAICARLDGLPLAIELAAARAPVLPPRALLRRLDRRLELLTVGARDLPERQSTLLATLDWSHDLLDEPERLLLRRMAVFAGGFTAEAAERVSGGDAVFDGLAALVEHSLLRRDVSPDGEPRFAMLETIREYSTRKLRASGEADAVHARHAGYMLELTERTEPDLLSGRAAAFDLLELEHDNLRAALDWAHAAARHDLELRLAGAVWWFWYLRVHDTEGLARLDAALTGAGAAAGAARAKALHGRGLLRARLAWLEEAEADGRELLALADQTNDTRIRALALHVLGGVAHVRGDYERARRLHERLATLARQTGDVTLLVNALDSGLADIALNERRFEQAAALSTEALEIARAGDGVERLITPLSNLASAHLGLGRADQATECFAQSLRHAQEVGDPEGIAWALEGLGVAAAALGHPQRAARLLGSADAALTASRLHLQRFEAHRHTEVVGQLHDELGDEAFAVAWAEGYAMTPDGAAAFALGDPTPAGRASLGNPRPPLAPDGCLIVVH